MSTIRFRSHQTAIQNRYERKDLMDAAAFNDAIPLKNNWADRWCTLWSDVEDHMKVLHELELRADDVFVVTFMKSGTTWMQEAAWLLLNDLNFEAAKSESLSRRSAFIELSGVNKDSPVNSIELCNNLPSPRLIKSHLPANLLPKQLWREKQKTIYVARNLKDVVVSSYNFLKGMGNWNTDIEDFVECFISNDITYSPFWLHIVEFWKMRHEPFIFFVTFEEMKRDLASVLQKLCEFLERPALTEDELKQMLEHLSFENMRENDCTNFTKLIKSTRKNIREDFQFMRRGIVGSYKDELSLENQNKLDKWSQEVLTKIGLKEEDIFGNMIFD